MSSTIQADIEARLARVEPEVEVLLAEVVRRRASACSSIIPTGSRSTSASASPSTSPAVRERYALEVSSPGPERPLTKPEHFRRFVGRRARVRTRGEHDGRRRSPGELLGATDAEVTVAADTGVVSIPTPTSTVPTCWETEAMSQEIVEAVRALGREKGISEEKLMIALEDALLSAYKKQPGAAKYARVRWTATSATSASSELIVPEELEDEPARRGRGGGRRPTSSRRVDPETGEVQRAPRRPRSRSSA